MTIRSSETEQPANLPAEAAQTPFDCVALGLIAILHAEGIMTAEQIEDFGGTCLFRHAQPNGILGLDGAIVHCSVTGCEAVGTIALDGDGRVLGSDPMLGMQDFEHSPSGAGPKLLAMLGALAQPPDTGA